jgi:SAM-dependent methyltransferase
LILDVGCGTGDFLAGMGCQWRKFGTDISEHARIEAGKRGVEAWEHIGEYYPFTFDVIVFRGTIQHLPDPFEQIGMAAKLLKPSGLLVFLATPDADSLCYKLFGDLPALDPPRNYWIPSVRTLTNVIQNNGLNVVRVLHPYGQPYAKPLQDAARFVGRLVGIKRKFAFPGNMFELYAEKERGK